MDLDGFKRGVPRVPENVNDYADAWVRKLLADRIADELQQTSNPSKRRSSFAAVICDGRRSAQGNVGDLIFVIRCSTMQMPTTLEYASRRRLNLLGGWFAHRAEVGSIFSNEFSQIVIEFDRDALSYDEVVDKLEEVGDGGGRVQEDQAHRVITYVSPDGAEFVFDMNAGRLEMSFGVRDCMKIVEAAGKYKLALAGGPSALLAAPTHD